MGRRSAAPYFIGKRINDLLLVTFLALIAFTATSLYFVLIATPKTERVEARLSAFAPFVALTELHLKISDLGEAIRLVRTFHFPEGTVRAHIVNKERKLLYGETFNATTLAQIEGFKETDRSNTGNVTITTLRKSPWANVYNFEFGLGNLGPNGEALDAHITVDDSGFAGADLKVFLLAIVFSVFAIVSLYATLRRMISNILSPLDNVAARLTSIETSGSSSELVDTELAGQSLEVQKVVSGFNKLMLKNQELIEQLVQFDTGVKMGELASQLAHDIRSPMTALNMVLTDVAGVPEARRLLVQSALSRINEIANELLSKYRSHKDERAVETCGPSSTVDMQAISLSVSQIVEEKKAQFAHIQGIQINFKDSLSTFGLFANIGRKEINSVLSNLINNAVEAIGEITGNVDIEVKDGAEKIFIIIADTGPGIPAHVLSRLGQKGFSFGKKEGSGLGLYLAKMSLRPFGGDLHIRSQPGAGTLITMELQKAETPAWFPQSLNFPGVGTLAVLDDDESIHRVWDERLSNTKANADLRVKHFKTPEEFRRWFEKADLTSPLFLLIDYEFRGCDETGLDVIQDLSLQNKSVLVTNKDQDGEIRRRCVIYGTHLLPKPLAPYVPLEVAVN